MLANRVGGTAQLKAARTSRTTLLKIVKRFHNKKLAYVCCWPIDIGKPEGIGGTDIVIQGRSI